MAGGKKYGVYVAPNAKGKVNARAAVRAINRQAGADVAKVVKNKARADAVVRLVKKVPGDNSAYTTRYGPPRKDRISVERGFVRKSSPKMNRNLAAHEIGHGLGLKHVEKRAFNLMNPQAIGINLKKQQVKKLKRTKRAGGYK